MKENLTKFFVNSAGAIVLVAALGRFLTAVSQAQVLSTPDPILGVPLRYGVLIVGGIELLVALICLFGKRVWLQAAWLAWLAADWIIFRAGLLFIGCRAPVTSVGSLTDPLHLSRGPIGALAAMCPFYLLLASYGTLAWLWMTRDSANSFSKMSCPACGTHIKFKLLNLGRMVPCPHCQAVVTLRKAEELMKTSCYFCKGHIEFPIHAIGTKTACPHCSMDITLKEPATA